MFNVGPEKLMVVLLVALIVLGPDKLPNAARQIGKYLSEFRRISQGFQQEIRSAIDMAAEPVTNFTKPTPTDPPAAPSSGMLPGEDPPPTDPTGAAAVVPEAAADPERTVVAPETTVARETAVSPEPADVPEAPAPEPAPAPSMPTVAPIAEPDRTASA
jgi:sec-independent protein translocase protein TatB